MPKSYNINPSHAYSILALPYNKQALGVQTLPAGQFTCTEALVFLPTSVTVFVGAHTLQAYAKAGFELAQSYVGLTLNCFRLKSWTQDAHFFNKFRMMKNFFFQKYTKIIIFINTGSFITEGI